MKKHLKKISLTLSPRFLLAQATFVFSIFFIFACSAKNISPRQEFETSQNTLSWLNSNYGIYQEEDLINLVHKVQIRLELGFAVVLKQNRTEKAFELALQKEGKRVNWKVLVLNSEELNAFSIGYKTIVLTKGLVCRIPNEASLAMILAHEMSHHYLGHIAYLIHEKKQQDNINFEMSLAFEMEADKLAVDVLNEAMYNRFVATQVLRVLSKNINSDISEKDGDVVNERIMAINESYSSKENAYAISDTREFRKIKRIVCS